MAFFLKPPNSSPPGAAFLPFFVEADGAAGDRLAFFSVDFLPLALAAAAAAIPRVVRLLGGDGVVAGGAARFPLGGMVVLDCAVKPQTRGDGCSLDCASAGLRRREPPERIAFTVAETLAAVFWLEKCRSKRRSKYVLKAIN